MTIDYTSLENAIRSLREGLDPPPKNDRERDGAIQRFEYTFELAWKFAKRALDHNGIRSTSPKTVIRDLAEQAWIADAALWMEFLRARNASSHSYEEKTAEEVFQSAVLFVPECEALLKRLKKETS